MACPSARDQASIEWSRNCFHCVAMSGLTGDAAIMRAQAWTHCSTTGFQNAVGSGGAAGDCDRRRAQACVLSSRPFLHMSKNACVGIESTITLTSIVVHLTLCAKRFLASRYDDR